MDQAKSVCWVCNELNQTITPLKGNLDERSKIEAVLREGCGKGEENRGGSSS